MPVKTPITALALFVTVMLVPSTSARADLLTELFPGGSRPTCPRYQPSPDAPCNVVVHRAGGNPTQDATGSIGHAKSYQSNGGPRCKTICRFTGTQY